MSITLHNRRATFQYFINERYVAGVILTGDEVKSIRKGSASIEDAYAIVRGGEAFIVNMQITRYHAAYQKTGYAERKTRKLLLSRIEIDKISGGVSRQGYTLIPLRGFFSKRGFFKIEIGLAKSKNVVDKRQVIKKRDAEREARQATKNRGL
jgi:SsrA-binding protein